MSSSKFCGLYTTTSTATASTTKPLRPRAVRLRDAVQKLADESQVPGARIPEERKQSQNYSFPTSTSSNYCKKVYDRTTRHRQSFSFGNSNLENEKKRLLEKGEAEREKEPSEQDKEFEWAREDQLSVILEILESEVGTRKNTPNWVDIEPSGEFPFHKEKGVQVIESDAVWVGKGKGKSVATATVAPARNLPKSEKGSIDLGRGRFFEEKAFTGRVYNHTEQGKQRKQRSNLDTRRRRSSWNTKQRRPSVGGVRSPQDRELRIIEEGHRLLNIYEREERERTGRMSDRKAPDSPRTIESPPRDVSFPPHSCFCPSQCILISHIDTR